MDDVELRQRLERLERLVDGYDEPMSVRNRMSRLEEIVRDSFARVEQRDLKVDLAKRVLDERGATTARRVRQVREWGSFAVALAAVLVAVLR